MSMHPANGYDEEFQAGVTAAKQGVPYTANPYERDRQQNAWAFGWQAETNLREAIHAERVAQGRAFSDGFNAQRAGLGTNSAPHERRTIRREWLAGHEYGKDTQD